MFGRISLFFLFIVLFVAGDLVGQETDPKIELADSIYYSDPDKSCKLCEAALEKAKANSDLDIVADAQMCLARYYLLKADYSHFEASIKAAIARFERIGSKTRLASAYNLYAIYYDRMDNKQKSYDYQNEAIRLFKEIENVQGMSNIMNNLANAYIHDNRLSQAKELLDQIGTFKDRITQGSLYFYYQNYGYLMFNLLKYNDALGYFEKALKIAEDKKMRDSEITALTFISRTYIKLKRFDDAVKFLTKAERLAEAGDFEYELQEIFSVQKDLYTIQKNDEELEKVDHKIAAFKVQKEEELRQIELAYKNDRKKQLEDKIKLQREKLRAKKAELEESRRPDYTIPIAIAAIVLLFLIFMIYRSKRKP